MERAGRSGRKWSCCAWLVRMKARPLADWGGIKRMPANRRRTGGYRGQIVATTNHLSLGSLGCWGDRRRWGHSGGAVTDAVGRAVEEAASDRRVGQRRAGTAGELSVSLAVLPHVAQSPGALPALLALGALLGPVARHNHSITSPHCLTCGRDMTVRPVQQHGAQEWRSSVRTDYTTSNQRMFTSHR